MKTIIIVIGLVGTILCQELSTGVETPPGAGGDELANGPNGREARGSHGSSTSASKSEDGEGRHPHPHGESTNGQEAKGGPGSSSSSSSEERKGKRALPHGELANGQKANRPLSSSSSSSEERRGRRSHPHRELANGRKAKIVYGSSSSASSSEEHRGRRSRRHGESVNGREAKVRLHGSSSSSSEERKGRHLHPQGPLFPPYLRNVSRKARREYFRIVANMSLTFAERRQRIKEWGNKYGIEDQVDEFDSKMADVRKELRKNVTELISQLPEASEKFSAVLDNEDLTPTQRCCALRNLTAENWKLYHVLKFAYGQFMIRQHRSHHGHGREGPFDELEQMYAFVQPKDCGEPAENISEP